MLVRDSRTRFGEQRSAGTSRQDSTRIRREGCGARALARSHKEQSARVALVTAQHDRVVASYTLLAAVGGLSMQRSGLNVMIYDPQVHYQQVRDAWIGVRTPDGR
jgi:hypothetical protein